MSGGQQHSVSPGTLHRRFVVTRLALGPAQLVDQAADPSGGQGQQRADLWVAAHGGGPRCRYRGGLGSNYLGQRGQAEVEAERLGTGGIAVGCGTGGRLGVGTPGVHAVGQLQMGHPLARPRPEHPVEHVGQVGH